MSETKLRDARIEKGWSQKRLADEMSVSLSTIKRWENGETYPRTNDQFRLEQILKIENKKENEK